MPGTIDLDLPFFLKETQLQHGLRGEDYDRYHAYLTNRVATIRKQLHLSNDRKKFLHKEITPANATDSRHLVLLVFYAERCWAAAETMLARVQLQKEEGRGAEKKAGAGGVPPPGQYRKRLNKAVKWAEKLVQVAAAVATPSLEQQCRAYLAEVQGRCHAAHNGEEARAKAAFLESRRLYFGLLQQCHSEASEGVLRQKLSEMDDRVLYCMQRLKEDVRQYVPEEWEKHGSGSGTTKAVGGGGAMWDSTVLSWNGRQLTVYSMKVKDALREARAVPVEELERKTLGEEGGSAAVPVVPVGQMNRVLDAFDRRIGYFNDALAHARQDLRATADGSHKTELQLIVHYCLFHVAEATLQRKLFMADVYARRFHATERAIKLQAHASSLPKGSLKKSEGVLPPAQYASSVEVIRLYEAALDTVEEMELLPGVAGRPDTETYRITCEAGKALFIGEGWRVLGQLEKAAVCYTTAMTLLKEPASQNPHSRAKQLCVEAERRSLRVESMHTLSTPTASSSSSFSQTSVALLTGCGGADREEATAEYLSEVVRRGSGDQSVAAHPHGNDSRKKQSASGGAEAGAASADDVVVAKRIIAFPPAYQMAPAKPTFVDIASTYVDFDEFTSGASSAANHSTMGNSASAGTGSHPPSNNNNNNNNNSNAGKAAQKGSGATEANEPSKPKWGFKWGWGSK